MMAEPERERIDPRPWMFRKETHITYICTLCGRRKTEIIKPATGPY